MEHEIYLDFCIWDYNDIDAESITEIMGIKPSKVYVKGESVNTKFPLRKSNMNGWRMISGMSKADTFESHLNSLLSLLESRIEIVQQFSEKYRCELACALYLSSTSAQSIPSIHLSKRYNDFVEKVKMDFDLDIYFLNS